MVHILDVPTDKITTLKECFYDVESYKTIMAELVKTNTDELYTYEIFNEFREKYKEALIAYDTAKVEFEFDFIKTEFPDAVSWNVTFGDNKISIVTPNKP